MKKGLLWLVLVGLLSLPLMAQDSRSELFGGFQFGHFGSVHTYDSYQNGGQQGDQNNISATINGVGWNGAYTFHINKSLGVAADFSGSYGSPAVMSGDGQGNLLPIKYRLQAYTIAVGPVYYFPSQGKLTPFVHVLVGGNTMFGKPCAPSETCGPSLNSSGGIAMFFGGGVDMKFKKKLAIRVGQFDWFHSAGEYGGNGNVRLSAGVVYHF